MGGNLDGEESESHPSVPLSSPTSFPASPGFQQCENFTPCIGNNILEEPWSHLFPV